MASIDWGDLVTVQSSEVLETRMPLLIESSRLCIDSGGAGTMRGGLSMQRSLRVLTDGARYSLLSDGAVLPAFGVLGGRSGFPVGCWIERDGGLEDFDTPGKVAGYPVEEGDIVLIRSAGGGGYGDPLERDVERVAVDVREGYVSRKAARELYGVVLNEGGHVDGLASSQCRERLHASRIMLRAVLDPAVFEEGKVSRRRICRLNPADIKAFGLCEDDVVELDALRAAPLRAWVRSDQAARPGTVPIDARGLAILKSADGDGVVLRVVSPPQRPDAQSPCNCAGS
jgi:N-methylhydantoinase B